MSKLFDLASAKINQKDNEKALEVLTQQVNENKFAFVAAKHQAEKVLYSAKSRAEALESDPSASPASILDAAAQVALAAKTVSDIAAVESRRF